MIDPADQVTLSLAVATDRALCRHFASPDRTYSVMLAKDLFGDWVLIQAWCGRYSRKGGSMTRPVADIDAGLTLMAAIIRTREKRGYVAIG